MMLRATNNDGHLRHFSCLVITQPSWSSLTRIQQSWDFLLHVFFVVCFFHGHTYSNIRERETGADSVKIQTINMVQKIAPSGWTRKLEKVLWDVLLTWKGIPIFSSVFFFFFFFSFFFSILLSDPSVVHFCILYLKFRWMKLHFHFFLRWPTFFENCGHQGVKVGLRGCDVYWLIVPK